MTIVLYILTAWWLFGFISLLTYTYQHTSAGITVGKAFWAIIAGFFGPLIGFILWRDVTIVKRKS